MFSIERFRIMRAKVKTIDDFPEFIQNLKRTGIAYYETYLEDGRADYYSKEGIKVSTPRKYGGINVADRSEYIQVLMGLELFGQDKTDYLTFCNDCAKNGVDKWVISIEEMSCTCYNKAGEIIFKEKIPARATNEKVTS